MQISQKNNVKERSVLFIERSVLFSIYIYINISIYIYIEKEQNILAFFYILCKRTECSFRSHKSPKTRKKNGKERNVPNGKERGAQSWFDSRKNLQKIPYSVFSILGTADMQLSHKVKVSLYCTIQVSAALKNTQVPKSIHVLNVISGPCSLRILLMSETLVPPIGDYK